MRERVLWGRSAGAPKELKVARPNKNGVCYYPKDVDFYQDEKVRYIRGRFGAKGMYLLDFLLCQIYGTCGYYLEWNNTQKTLIADAAGCDCTPGFVQELVTACLSQGLFDENRATVCGILTSAGIQRRYLRMVASRDAVYLVDEYLLLDKSSKKDFPDGILGRVIFKKVSEKKTPVSEKKTPVFYESIDKVKKRKENNTEGVTRTRVGDGETEEEEADRLFARFWEAYPRKDNITFAIAAFRKLLPSIGGSSVDGLIEDVKKRSATNQWTKDNGAYIPVAGRYLCNRLWEEPIKESPTQTGNDTAKPKKPKKRQNKAPGGVSQKDKEVELLAWDIIANELETEEEE